MKEVFEQVQIGKGFSFSKIVKGILKEDNKTSIPVIFKKLNSNVEFAVRYGEIQASISAGKLGIGALIHDFEYPSQEDNSPSVAGALIMEAINGAPLKLCDLQNKETRNLLLQVLNKLHAADLNDFPKNRTIIGQISKNLQIIKQVYPKLVEKLSPLVEQLILINHALSNMGNLCVCHNDLQVDNIFKTKDNSIKLIDWEFAGVGNPYIELGILVNLFGIKDETLEKLLIEFQEKNQSKVPLSELYLGRQMHLMLVCTFSLVMLKLAYSEAVPDLNQSNEKFLDSQSVLQAYYKPEGFPFTGQNLHLLASLCFKELKANFKSEAYKGHLKQVQTHMQHKLPHLEHYYKHINDVEEKLKELIIKPKNHLVLNSIFQPETETHPKDQTDQNKEFLLFNN